MVKKLPRVEKKVKLNFKKKNLKDWTKLNRKMGGRSCSITSGAFGHGLTARTAVHWLNSCGHGPMSGLGTDHVTGVG